MLIWRRLRYPNDDANLLLHLAAMRSFRPKMAAAQVAAEFTTAARIGSCESRWNRPDGKYGARGNGPGYGAIRNTCIGQEVRRAKRIGVGAPAMERGAWLSVLSIRTRAPYGAAVKSKQAPSLVLRMKTLPSLKAGVDQHLPSSNSADASST